MNRIENLRNFEALKMFPKRIWHQACAHSFHYSPYLPIKLCRGGIPTPSSKTVFLFDKFQAMAMYIRSSACSFAVFKSVCKQQGELRCPDRNILVVSFSLYIPIYIIYIIYIYIHNMYIYIHNMYIYIMLWI